MLFEYVPLFSKVKQCNKLIRKPFNPTDTKRIRTAIPVIAAQKSVASTTVNDDDDIFSAAVEDERSENFAHATNELVGGDTASFAPLVLDEDEDEEEEDDTSSSYEANENN